MCCPFGRSFCERIHTYSVLIIVLTMIGSCTVKTLGHSKKRERIGVARLCVSHENSLGVANSDLETEGKMGLRIAASWLGGLLKMTQSCKVDEEARLDKQTNKLSYLHGVL